jgi:hypothetical protein
MGFSRTSLIDFSEIKDQLALASLVYNFGIDLKVKKKEDKYDLKNLDITKIKLNESRTDLLVKALDKSPNAELAGFYETSAGAQVGITLSHSEKRISVIFRGSNQAVDWLHDFMICKKDLDDGKKVHLGFWKTLMKENLYEKLKKELKENIEEHTDYGVYISGHSLGGGLATLFGYLFGLENEKKLTIISFASPRVGNQEWSNKFNTMNNIRHYRVVNEKDVVTAMPYVGFYHCGNEIKINARNDLGFVTYPIFLDVSHIFSTYNPIDHFIENYYKNLELCEWDSSNRFCQEIDSTLI